MTAYKVVKERTDAKGNRTFTSIAARGYCQASYAIGTKTKAKRALMKRGYYLTAFKSLGIAQDFCFQEQGTVLMCEAEGEHKVPVRRFMIFTKKLSYKTIARCLDGKYQLIAPWPMDTCMFESLLPLEVVPA
jgi:hypothetical protein